MSRGLFNATYGLAYPHLIQSCSMTNKLGHKSTILYISISKYGKYCCIQILRSSC